jgi:hypothetical protein
MGRFIARVAVLWRQEMRLKLVMVVLSLFMFAGVATAKDKKATHQKTRTLTGKIQGKCYAVDVPVDQDLYFTAFLCSSLNGRNS